MSRGLFGLVVFVLTGAVLVVQVLRLNSLRRRDVSVIAMLIAGPLLFIRPDRYFPDDRLSAPWRMLMWFVVWIGVVALVATWLQT